MSRPGFDAAQLAGGGATARPPLLAIETATTVAVVAIGTADGGLLAHDAWDVGHRHAEELVPRIAALLAAAGIARPGPGALAGVVVGTGPGGFTGLRVGLATARGIARAGGIAVVGVPTGETLLAAARRAGAIDPAARAALLLPAGPAGRYLVRDGRAALIPAQAADDAAPADAMPGDAEPAGRGRDEVVVAVDLAGRAPADAVERGLAARGELAAALVALGAARLGAGGDDTATLAPEYVTMPRGVTATGGEVAWSPARP